MKIKLKEQFCKKITKSMGSKKLNSDCHRTIRLSISTYY